MIIHVIVQNPHIGEYGRFDVSWTSGGSNTTRLSNWLDPNNTGAFVTNTTNVSDLIPTPTTGLAISGNEAFCTGTSQYTLNVPAGVNVSWETSNLFVATVPATGNPATVTKTGDGVVTITATITVCNTTMSVSNQIIVGIPPVNFVSFTNPVGGEGYWCSSHYGNSFTVDPTLSSATYEANLLSWPSMTLVRTNPNANPGGSDPFGYVPQGWYVFQLRATNTCGTTSWYETEVEYVDCSNNGSGGDFRISASPNPTHGELNIIIDKEKPEVKALSKNEKVKYVLYDLNRTQVKQWTFDNNQNQQKLNVGDIKPGQYILVVTKGKYQQSTQIIIQ
jgi:hypothetical protein